MADAPKTPAPTGSGPWFIKVVGHYGTGRRSLMDYEIYVIDLSAAPENDPVLPDGSEVITSFISEDVAPARGMDVQIGPQVIRQRDAASIEWEVADRE